ncbi:ABC transporter permease [Halococcus agarilyticus]|uniref:ABC transporter permease n=1 Tax=Halococcus agarilyticus TaxID=1232219 RepID=UPI000677ADEC|nr:ABC transporter permease [Halococcus agarilyticus]
MSTRSATDRIGEWFSGSLPSPTRGMRKLLSLVGFLGVWWVFYQFGVLNFEHFVSPGTALVAFGEVLAGRPLIEGGDTIYLHAVYSTVRVALGVGVAAVLAIPLGLVVGTSRRWENLLYPALEALRPIPPIAWLPIAIIVFPAIALGSVSIPLSALFVVFVGAFFPIFTNTIEGARNVEAEFRRAAESLGASATNVFRHVVLPATLPSIITGLSLGVGLGWITVVAAELVTGGPGLGYIIIRGSRLRNKQTIVIGMLAVGALGYASSALVAALGRRLTPWSDSD